MMKRFSEFIEEQATISKNVSYRGNTTGEVQHHVHDANGKLLGTFKTKKEAQKWADVHNLSKDELHKKYPDLKP